MTAALLTLADSRLPSGGHAHSGGIEQAVTDGLVRISAGIEDPQDLIDDIAQALAS